MEFNTRFSNILTNIFDSTISNNSHSRLSDELTLDKNNVFNRSLTIDIKSIKIEIPIIARNLYEDIIINTIKNPYSANIERIILPLYVNTPNEDRRTFDSIIIRMFSVDYNSRLQKITTTTGDIYYGGKGIIFDANFTPLLLCTLTARRVHKDNEDHIVYYRPICHINPKVFMEPNNLINKGIIKKVIPIFSNMEVAFPYRTAFAINPNSYKVKVIIDNFDNFFIKPIKPTPSTCSNDLLNQCLVDNIEDIMMLV